MILVNRIPQNEEKGVYCIMYNLVPDPDLQGEGGRRDGLKNIFPALRASVWSKNKRGGGGWGPALDPPL